APFVARVREDDLVEMAELRARLGDSRLVLLAPRAPERGAGDTQPLASRAAPAGRRGDQAERLDPVAGRTPGARNAYSREPLPEDVLEAPELVVYCGSGVRAAPGGQRLVLAGRDDGRVY